ncbi:MAG: DegT/DnrJ/EryC1/StrS family aminotransferase [Verrucomicrobia bacterium]|nr:DegT/DnrJ/EryC1/StrS family aminotransferase [Verrucomicrobiota bacterium]
MKPLKEAMSRPTADPVSRRQFLAASTALLGAATTVTSRAAEGTSAATADPLPPIDPGYVGPAFFDAREREALLEVWESRSPFRYWGPGQPVKVREFEEAFAKQMGTRFALGVTSGTAALDCAVAALGIGPGDEVIVPAYTWWSDYTCVVHAGALPVFAEIDRTLNLDPEDFARRITPRTKAVIPVHLLGGPCAMDRILEIARERRIAVIEDCAQCVGGSYRGRRLGSLGDLGIYSFQINKTITSGEGGAVVSNDPLLYERAVRFHDMGGFRSLFAERTGGSRAPVFAGENFRMSEFTGAVLGAQLTKLDQMLAALRTSAEAIRRGIEGLPGLRLRTQPDPAGDIGTGVFFEVASRAERDRCIRALQQEHVPAATLTGSVLLPLDEAVVAKRTRHAAWPSFTSPEGRAIRYGPECCPQTSEIFDRFVQVRIGPRYTPRINDHIVAVIRGFFTGAARS